MPIYYSMMSGMMVSGIMNKEDLISLPQITKDKWNNRIENEQILKFRTIR